MSAGATGGVVSWPLSWLEPASPARSGDHCGTRSADCQRWDVPLQARNLQLDALLEFVGRSYCLDLGVPLIA